MQKNKGTKVLASSHALAPLAIAIASITSQLVYAADAGTEQQYQNQVANGSVSTIEITENIDLGVKAYRRAAGNSLTLQSKTLGTRYQVSAPAYDYDNDEQSRALILGDEKELIPSGPALAELRDLEFRNFEFIDGRGGALFLGGGLTHGMHNVVFHENTSHWTGGGFHAFGNFAGGISYAKFINNTGVEGGGGFSLQGDFTGDMDTVEFSGNDADVFEEAKGGGGFALLGDFSGTMKNVQFSHNFAVGYGGAFAVDRFTGTLTNSTFINNRVSDVEDDEGFLKNKDAKGDAEGGAIYAFGGLNLVKNSLFLENAAINRNTAFQSGYGGAVYLGNSVIDNSTFENNTFLGNRASGGGEGGAIYYEHQRSGVANLNIAAMGTDKRALFYGNLSNNASNALYIGLADGFSQPCADV